MFVGRVVEIYPARETFATQSEQPALPELRRRLLQRWRGALSADEERFIRTSENRDEIESRFGRLQRIRFAVSEVLAGPQVREVYTDESSCGYRFEPGLDYLVNSFREGDRYRTGACSGTALVGADQAVENLKALRAYKSGAPLAPRIYGRIHLADLRPDATVRLIGGGETRPVRLGADGRFSLDGLDKAKYRLQVEDARGAGEREINLATLGCSDASPWFSNGWHIAGSPTVVPAAPPPAPFVDEPPAELLVPHKQ